MNYIRGVESLEFVTENPMEVSKKGQWDAGLDAVANKESSDKNICNTFEKYILCVSNI